MEIVSSAPSTTATETMTFNDFNDFNSTMVLSIDDIYQQSRDNGVTRGMPSPEDSKCQLLSTVKESGFDMDQDGDFPVDALMNLHLEDLPEADPVEPIVEILPIIEPVEPLPETVSGVLFTMDKFINVPMTTYHNAFNLLGCMVYAKIFPGSIQGKEAVMKVYENIGTLEQIDLASAISEYVNDSQNGVVIDENERTVSIARAPLASLVSKNEQIKAQFGTKEGASTASIRNYFSALSKAWKKNHASGGKHSYLGMFEYINGSLSECRFEFKY